MATNAAKALSPAFWLCLNLLQTMAVATTITMQRFHAPFLFQESRAKDSQIRLVQVQARTPTTLSQCLLRALESSQI